MRQECRKRFPRYCGLAIPTYIRHVRDARAVMHAGIANYRFPLPEVGGGENVIGIPSTCATPNFTIW